MNLKEIALAHIAPDPEQPRTDWESPEAINALDELTASIKVSGILQPLLVREGSHDRYIIIDGERRYRACKVLHIQSLPCYVRDDMETADRHAAQLFANLARRGLTPDEIANGIAGLHTLGYKAVELAEKLGKSAGWVSKQLAYAVEPQAQELRDQGLLNSASAYADFKTLPEQARQAVVQHHIATGTPIQKATITRIGDEFNVDGILQQMKQDSGAIKPAGKNGNAKDSATYTHYQRTESWAKLVQLHDTYPDLFTTVTFMCPLGLID